MSERTIDLPNHPGQCFLVDTFSVPAPARAELEAAMARTLAFLRSLPGFRGRAVLAEQRGPAGFGLVTVAAWESAQALERAGEAVRTHHRTLGFDLPGALAAWGVRTERGIFELPPGLQ